MSGAAVEKSFIPEDPEDLKLITLARAALARTGARQGAVSGIPMGARTRLRACTWSI